MTTKTPEQIAAQIAHASKIDGSEAWERVYSSALAAFEVDRAQRFEVPAPLAGAIQASDGGVFVNDRGDYIVEPIGDDTLELIYVRADGTTATGRGEWSTGWDA